MNEKGLRALLNYLDYSIVKKIKDADLIFSPSKYLNTKRYPDKIYIFGPHFATFPNRSARLLSNKYGNAAYIMPSQTFVDMWVQEFSFNNLPCYSFPFPLIMDDYPMPCKKKTKFLSIIK